MARRRSRQEWKQIVLEWQRSGLKRAAFARRHGLKLKTFEFWCWALKAEMAAPAAAELKLLPVHAAAGSAGHVVEHVGDDRRAVVDLSRGGLRVEFSLDADPRSVAELVAALRGTAC
jgi:hypothetical protein